ncbi:hypothetical protein [Roseateles sp. PN1]|uniref:hypothetical protein n=1 Tax=Roseateles sp. PN1 TaxID=3137372 RepID=UPI003138FFC1
MNHPTTTLNRTRRIDWARILANLQTAGMSMQQIADAVECGKSTLYGYASEDLTAEPAYWIGHCLVALWATKCGASLQDVPIKKVQLSVSAMLKDMA